MTRYFALTLNALVFGSLLGLTAPMAAAQQTQAEEPDIVILSDTLTYDDLKKESVFTGNVVMTRGPMTLYADNLVMRETDDGAQYGTATMNQNALVRVRQENAEKFEVIEAEGLRAEYNGTTEEVEMIGRAVVTRYICGKPFDEIRGERVLYRQSNSTYQAFGGANSSTRDGRVRSVAQSRAKVDAALAECQKKAGLQPQG